MNYAITGGAGNISAPLTRQLLRTGHQVTVIGRTKAHLEELRQLGARPAIGSLEDTAFLTAAFSGADAVYTMCPPNDKAADIKEFNATLGANYAEAISANAIKYVVNLSSIGAHLPQGAGPASGLYRVEQTLNALKGVNVKHLRPAYFYYNLFAFMDMIKHAGMIGSNFSNAGKRFPVSDAADIAAVAAEELTGLHYSGHSVRYIASDETDTGEIAAVLGHAIGIPGLSWVPFADEQAFSGLLQAGLSKELAAELVEIGQVINSGKMLEDYWISRPVRLGSVKLKDFARVFATIYNQSLCTVTT